MFDPILKAIGTFLAWIDSWAGNYLLVLLIFSVLVELIFLPLGIKQQKNSIRQAKLRPKEMAIRRKYAGRNDNATQQKIAAEIQELYRQENFNQFAGCLPALIQLPIILLLYNVVIKPLEYVVQLNSATISKLVEKGTAVGDFMIAKIGNTNGGSIKLVSVIQEQGLDFFRQNNFDVAAMADLEQHFGSMPDFNFLGINLGYTPTVAWNWLLIIPVLTFVVYFFSMKLTRKFTYQPATATNQQMGCSNNIMDIGMPLFSLFIAFSVPAAVGVYWIFKSITGTLKQFILMKLMPLPVCSEADIKAAEKELKGKTPVVERDAPAGEVKSLLHEEDDDDEPYPTFVGTKGGKYDDDSEPDDKNGKQESEKNTTDNGISEKLDVAPVKDDDRNSDGKKK